MELKINKHMQFISLALCLVIAAQLAMIFLKGDTVCLNEGCRIVEGLTRVSPLYFNLIGLLYFLTLFVSLRWFRVHRVKIFDWPRILLLAGIAVEGVLVAYQIFVAKVLCSYCLFIFAMVLLLNIYAGREQLLKAVSVFIGVNVIFSMLSFGPSPGLFRGDSLTAGTFGSRTCTDPAEELYLIFSEDCPHCIRVIEVLENCDSCDFHFNPISAVKNLDLPGISRNQTFDPEINRVLLTLLGIETVPVLLVRNPDGLSVIKGEKNIIRYVETACFRDDP